MAGENKRVLCSAFRCEADQEWKVFYRTSVGLNTTDSWAKVCRRHATDELWPISWGTILRREPITQ